MLLSAALSAAALAPHWSLRLPFSLIGALILVRTFILFHDVQHGSMLPQSKLGRGLYFIVGLLFLTPAPSWRRLHNTHHHEVARPLHQNPEAPSLVTSDVGAYGLMTTTAYRQLTFGQRLAYRISRHSLTIALGYLTVFMFMICLIPFVQNPRKNWDGGLAILTHGAAIALIAFFGGAEVLVFSWLGPFVAASALGSYLFFSQHSFPDFRLSPEDEWSQERGALESSSYTALGPVMHWFTGNIGYHHVHHASSRIPFYRLPQAMAAIPALQNPPTTSLHPREVLRCLSLNLWDPESQRLVSYSQAAKAPLAPDDISAPNG